MKGTINGIEHKIGDGGRGRMGVRAGEGEEVEVKMCGTADEGGWG